MKINFNTSYVSVQAIKSVQTLASSFETMITSINSTIVSVLGSSATSLKKSFWSLKEKINPLLAKNGNLTSRESQTLQSLISNIESVSQSLGDKGIDTTSQLIDIRNNLKFDKQVLKVALQEDNIGLVKSVDTLSIKGVTATVSVGDNGEILSSLVAKNFNIGIGQKYEDTIKALINAGYRWDGDGNLDSATALKSIGFTWNGDGNLNEAQALKSIGFTWDGDKNLSRSELLKSIGYKWDKDQKLTRAEALKALGFTWDGDGKLSKSEALKSIGFIWNKDQKLTRAEALKAAGYAWDKDRKLTTAQTLVDAGYKWDKDGKLVSAADMKNAKYLWNKDGLRTAVSSVSTVTENGKHKLKFDWNNDKVVDATAIIGQDGTLTDIRDNTGTNSETTVGVLSALNKSITSYNKNIEKSLKVDTTPLGLSDFKAGGLLKTADEISFRQSFKPDNASSFNTELENLRKSLSYLSLSTTDVSKYLNNLAKADSTTFNNIGEFFKSVGIDNKTYDFYKNASTGNFNAIQKTRSSYDKLFASNFGNAARKSLLNTDFYQKNYATYAEIPDADKMKSFFNHYTQSVTTNDDFFNMLNRAKKLVSTSKLLNSYASDGKIDIVEKINLMSEDISKNTGFMSFLKDYHTVIDKDTLDEVFNDIKKSLTLEGYKLPSYDVGTSYIPKDQIANVHKGEMIIPRNFADSIRSGQLNLGANNINYNTDISSLKSELRLINDKLGKVIAIQDRQLTTQRATLAEVGA